MISLKPIFAIVILSFIGLIDSSYLTFKHYLGLPLSCSFLQGCEKVLSSQYATIGNFPLATLGVVYYFAILLVSLGYLLIKQKKIVWLIFSLSPLGFLLSLWLVYLQLFVLKAICLYCIISAITSTLIFILSLTAIKTVGSRINPI